MNIPYHVLSHTLIYPKHIIIYPLITYFHHFTIITQSVHQSINGATTIMTTIAQTGARGGVASSVGAPEKPLAQVSGRGDGPAASPLRLQRPPRQPWYTHTTHITHQYHTLTPTISPTNITPTHAQYHPPISHTPTHTHTISPTNITHPHTHTHPHTTHHNPLHRSFSCTRTPFITPLGLVRKRRTGLLGLIRLRLILGVTFWSRYTHTHTQNNNRRTEQQQKNRRTEQQIISSQYTLSQH